MMGMIMSPINEIDNLYFRPIPNRRMISGRISLVDRVIIVLGDDGQLYANTPISDGMAYYPGIWPWTKSAMQALVRLKVITQAVADEHMRRCTLIDRKRSAGHALDYITTALAEHGLTLPQEHIDRLTAIKEGKDYGQPETQEKD